MENFHTPAQRFRKIRCSHWHDHEFLEVDGTVRVRAAVENIHHWNGQKICGRIRGIPGKIFVERLLQCDGSCARCGHGHSQNSIGAQPRFRRRAIQRNHFVIEGTLLGSIQAGHRFANFAVGIRNCFQNSFAHIARLVSITQFQRFVLASGRARWNRRSADCAGRQRYIGFHSGIAARIDNLARVYSCNFRGHYFGESPWNE